MADEFKGINQETLKNIEALKGSMKEISEATAKANRQLQQQGSLIQDYRKNYSDIASSAGKFAKLQDEASKSASATGKALKEQQSQLSNIRSLNAQIDNLMDQMIGASKEEEKILQKQVNNLSAARDNAQELVTAYGELVDDSSKLDRSTMWFSSLSEVVKDIPGLRKLSGPFELAAKAARETVINNAKIKSTNESIASLGTKALQTGRGLTKEKLKQAGLDEITQGKSGTAAAQLLKQFQSQNKVQSAGMAGLKAGFSGLGPIIKSALGPLALIQAAVDVFKFFIDSMFEADKRITNLSRNLQVSKSQAEGIDSYFKSIKGSLETQYKLTKEIYQAQAELSELSAASVLYNKDNLDAQIQLTKEYGLQVQDAASLNKFFITSGQSATKGLDVAAKTTSEFFKRTGVLMSERKLLEQAAKVSGQMLVSFKGSTKELINAVAKANLLGISLDKAKDISMSMLNFEESISSELEAELLTGKNLNLDRARALALQGKFVDAAEAAVKEVGTLEEFQNMNVLQQEALAKAAGLTVDQLSDAFIQQKLIGETSKQQYALLKEAGQDELARRYALGEASDKEIKAANKRLDAQEKFNIAMDQIKEVFSDLVTGGTLDKIANFAKAFANTIASGGSLFTLNPFGESDLSRNIRAVNREEAIKKQEAADDFIIRPGQPIQKFNKDDIVIGGTNLLGGGNGEVVTLLRELVSAVRTGGSIYLDSEKVGTVIGMSTFKSNVSST